MALKTGFVWAERYAWYDTGTSAAFLPIGEWLEPEPHIESPASKRRLRNLLDVSGLLDQLHLIPPRLVTEDELLRLHRPEYVARVRELSAGEGGEAGEETPFGPGGYDVARLSAGGCMAALDAVVGGEVRYAYALNRPPGHHAEAHRGRGFCMFANIPLALLHARAVHGLKRAAVLDWDVHHGNGTEDAFYEDPSVLTISIHQDNNYPPDRGRMEDNGRGAGLGANLNIPLPPGSGHGAYLAVIEQVVVPALRRFRPELIVVASGFDASAMDPLGRMMCTSETYREMTGLLMQAAAELCRDRLLFCHEGGYSTTYVPFCGLAVLEQLSGIRTAVEDPFLEGLAAFGGQALQTAQAAVIAQAAALVGRIPAG